MPKSGVPEDIALLLKSDKVCISSSEAAKVLHCTPYLINVQAREGKLPFPAFFVGNRLRIPRIPFLQYIGYEC